MSGSGPVENLTCNNIAKRAGLVCFHIGILLIVLVVRATCGWMMDQCAIVRSVG